MGLRVALLALAACVAACTLLIDTDGLTGDGVPMPSSSTDAAVDGHVDGAHEAGDATGGAPVDHPYVQAVLADGPSLYYRLEEAIDGTAADATGNHPGMYLAGGVHGVEGAFPGSLALRLSRSGGIDPGDIFDFTGTVPFTLEAWFRPDGYDRVYRFLFHHNDELGAARQNYGLYVESPDGLGFERYVDGEGRSIKVALPSLRQWHHIVAVYTGAVMRLHVDGQLVGTENDGRAARDKRSPLNVAYGYPDGDGALIGTVDEIAIYEKALEADRIRAHFEAAR